MKNRRLSLDYEIIIIDVKSIVDDILLTSYHYDTNYTFKKKKKRKNYCYLDILLFKKKFPSGLKFVKHVHRFIKLSKRAGRHPSPWFFLSNETKKKKKQKQKKKERISKELNRSNHSQKKN